jgi:hypothetical protein
MNNLSVSISKNLGRYNLCSNEKSWCLSLMIHGHPVCKSISETFPEDDEPDIHDVPPSEVVEIIAARVESYWISTSREESRKKIEAIREHAAELDDAWATKIIRSLQNRVDELSAYLIKREEVA